MGAQSAVSQDSGVVVGFRARVDAMGGLAIGTWSRVGTWVSPDNGKYATAIGFGAATGIDDSVALGSNSFVDTAGGVSGYVPFGGEIKADKAYVWKSVLGAVSIGDKWKGWTRQITAVAAGTEDTDAVNVAQLKAVEKNAGSWQTSVNGKDNTVVHTGEMVDFSAGSNNLTIIKDSKDNGLSLKFDLAKEITLDSVKIGTNTFNATGLIIANGPKITTGGIDVGSKKITGVAEGTDDTDAVNFAQLQKVQTEVTKQVGFVKQNAETQHITIGKDVGGDKIDIANNEHEKRTLTGIKAGTLTKTSTDAVNGSQLYSLNKTLATYFGGGAAYEDEKWTAPTFTLTIFNEDGSLSEHNYSDIAAAFAGISTSFKNLPNGVSDNPAQSDNSARNALLWSDGDKAFVALHGKGDQRSKSKLKFLLDGDISEGSTEAITGNQLYQLNQTLAQYFGGGAKYENGQWTAPTFTLTIFNEDGSLSEHNYSDIAAAFAGISTSFKNLPNGVSDNPAQSDNSARNALLWSDGDKAFVALHGKGDQRSKSKLKFLLDGDISEGSTEAITGNQLYQLNQTLAQYFGGGAKYENGQWTAPTFTLTIFNEDGSLSEHNYSDIAAAFAGISTSFKNLPNGVSDNPAQSDNSARNALLWSDGDKAFVALHGKGDQRSKSKLKFLLDGDISEGSTEAITGNQLYQLNQTLAQYFGGGASYQGGQWRAPDFKVAQLNSDGSSSDDKIYHDVAGAFGGVSDSMKSINDRINDVANNLGTTNGLKWNEEQGGYDASHKGVASKITHVLDGKIEAGSQEAVNGGQLWTTNEKVKEVEQKVDKIDQHVKDIEVAVTDGAVNYDKGSDGKKSNSITLVGGDESAPVLIENVEGGKIEKGSHQAVNGGQLHDYTEEKMKLILAESKDYTDRRVNNIVIDAIDDAVERAKQYTDMKFEMLNYAVEDVRKEARQAAAIGLAVSNLRYYDIPGSLSVSLGSGFWRNQSAFAIGAGYTSEDGNIRSNVSITNAGGHWGIGAGITLRVR